MVRILHVLEALGGLLVGVLHVLEALGGAFVRILRALRPWEARTYVFYEVLKPPGFEGPGCGKVKLARIGAHPSRADKTKDLQLDHKTIRS